MNMNSTKKALKEMKRATELSIRTNLPEDYMDKLEKHIEKTGVKIKIFVRNAMMEKLDHIDEISTASSDQAQALRDAVAEKAGA